MLQRLHTFIRDIAKRERSGFVRNNTITEAINMASNDLWQSLVKKMRAGGGESYLLQPFRKSTTLSETSGIYQHANAAQNEPIALEAVNESTPQILLTSDGEFPSTRKMLEFDHIMKSEFVATINSTGQGKFDLPDDLFETTDSFYHEYNGNRYEGHILDDNEFIDRRNSYIQPADEEHPIARIVDDKIEFYPIPTGASTFDFTVPYKKFNPVFRYKVSGNDMVFIAKPLSFTENVNIFYIERPAVAATSDGAIVDGQPTITIDTELNWNEGAMAELATRALVYIGVEINNQLVSQIEGLTEQTNAIDVNN